MFKIFKKYFTLIATVLLILLFLFIGKVVSQAYLHSLIADAGVFAPIVFMLLALLIYIVLPWSSTLIFITGYFAFGPSVIIYLFFSAMFSALIDFLIAKTWGRKIVVSFTGEKRMQQLEKHFERYEYKMLFFLRLLQEEIFITVSYAAGLTSMRLLPYMVITLLGTIPGSILRYFILRYLHNPFTYIGVNLTATVIMTVIFLSIIIVFRLKEY